MGLRSEFAGMMKLTYEIELLCIEVFRQEGRPCENFIALGLWDLVKLGANQQQRHRVLSKLLSIIVTAGRKLLSIQHYHSQGNILNNCVSVYFTPHENKTRP